MDHLQSIGATILPHNHHHHSNDNDNDNDNEHHHYNNDNRQGREVGGKGREGNYITASAPVRVWESLLVTRFFVLRSHQPRPQPQPPRPLSEPLLSKPRSLFLARQTKHSTTRAHPTNATASTSTSATASASSSTTTPTTTTTTAADELVRCHSYSLPIELVDHVAFVFNTVQLPLTRNGVYSPASSSPSPSSSSSSSAAAATNRTTVHQNTLDNTDDGGSGSTVNDSANNEDVSGGIVSMGASDLRPLSPNCLANNTMSLCRLQQGNTNPTMFIPVVMYFHHIPLLPPPSYYPLLQIPHI